MTSPSEKKLSSSRSLTSGMWCHAIALQWPDNRDHLRILLWSGDITVALFLYLCMYVCMYYFCMYMCMCSVCMYVCMYYFSLAILKDVVAWTKKMTPKRPHLVDLHVILLSSLQQSWLRHNHTCIYCFHSMCSLCEVKSLQYTQKHWCANSISELLPLVEALSKDSCWLKYFLVEGANANLL